MGSVFVKCLGSGDAFGSGGRFNTSFYIRTGGKGILMDCGASTLIALKKEKLSMQDIDVVLITHFHGDHFGGLPFVLCEIAAVANRKKLLTIIGPEGIRENSLQSLACFYPGVELTDESNVRFMSFTAGIAITLDNISVNAFEVIHSPETRPHALRIECDGKVVAYSGDTQWTDALIDVSRDADLFICEGSTYDKVIKNHLSIQEVLSKRHLLSAKKIVFTHLSEAALKVVPTRGVDLADDGMVLLEE